MNKDKLITILTFFFTLLSIFLVTRSGFLDFADEYKLIAGFIKFFVLATIGDFISLRIKNDKWSIPNNILLKAIVWGLIGIVIVMIFDVFVSGVNYLQTEKILPFKDVNIATAFFISVLMNLTFAPTMMAFHRVSDIYLDNYKEKKLSIQDSIKAVDFERFVSVVVFKTIPLFWIPAHTITFMLPAEYRVIFAAILGIFLGLILGLTNKK